MLSILFPEIEDIEELISIHADYFAIAEQTNIALNIPHHHYRYYAEFITKKAFDLNQIFIAKINGEIAGYLIWEDYINPLVLGIKARPEVYEMVKPEIAFVEELEKTLKEFPDFKENECAKLMQVAVLPQYQNEGIASKLANEAIRIIIDKGYKFIIADCTAENSWQILVKFGFNTICEIDYKDFIYAGKNPFSKLTGKRRLVIKKIEKNKLRFP